MVPAGGLEPPHISAGDFESPMSTNSITPAVHSHSIVSKFMLSMQRILNPPCIPISSRWHFFSITSNNAEHYEEAGIIRKIKRLAIVFLGLSLNCRIFVHQTN